MAWRRLFQGVWRGNPAYAHPTHEALNLDFAKLVGALCIDVDTGKKAICHFLAIMLVLTHALSINCNTERERPPQCGICRESQMGNDPAWAHYSAEIGKIVITMQFHIERSYLALSMEPWIHSKLRDINAMGLTSSILWKPSYQVFLHVQVWVQSSCIPKFRVMEASTISKKNMIQKTQLHTCANCSWLHSVLSSAWLRRVRSWLLLWRTFIFSRCWCHDDDSLHWTMGYRHSISPWSLSDKLELSRYNINVSLYQRRTGDRYITPVP